MEPNALAFSVVVGLALCVFVILARRSRRARERLSSQWLDAEAEVLDVWQDGMGSYCVRYRFTPHGSAHPVTRDQLAGCLRVGLPEAGERVPVRYDPQAPEHALLQREGC
ncbi:MAG: DUF3592 domain-containing protein [Betaproteobacteria bacterium]|nr:DUF3592 domain-containing protein [Betaproteobacteria bacterium]